MCAHGHDGSDRIYWLSGGRRKSACRACNRAKAARQHADGTHKRQARGAAAPVWDFLGVYGALVKAHAIQG